MEYYVKNLEEIAATVRRSGKNKSMLTKFENSESLQTKFVHFFIFNPIHNNDVFKIKYERHAQCKCGYNHVSNKQFDYGLFVNNGDIVTNLNNLNFANLDVGLCDKCGQYNKTYSSHVKSMPQLMVVSNDVTNLYTPNEICFDNDKEKYEYKLIGVVDSRGGQVGGHVFSKIKLENGDWLEIDDTPNKLQKIDFDECSENRKLLFYEKINK